jgi:hypothetical protein
MKTNALPCYLPSPDDFPREELMALAADLVGRGGKFEGRVIHFTWRCQWCGERNQFIEPFMLGEIGVCCFCDGETESLFGSLVFGKDT